VSLGRFYEKYLDELETQIRIFSQVSTLKNHLMAVLRPFGDKNLAIYAKALGQEKLSSMRQNASALSQKVLRTQVELEDWKVLVWKNFDTHLVLEGVISEDADSESKGRSRRQPPIPLGLVGRTTARIYKQRWDSWFEANLGELLDFVLRGHYEPAPDFSSASQVIRGEPVLSDEGPKTQQASSGPESANSTPADGVSIKIRVSSALDQNLSADRIWADSLNAKSEATNWVNLLKRIWGESSTRLNATISGASSGSNFEFTLPTLSPEELCLSLSEVLDENAIKMLVPPDKNPAS